MADTNITIPELGSLTAGQVSDLLLVTRGTTGYKMLVSDIAKTIIETYQGSSLAGSTQSVKAALDSLNSRGTLTNIGITANTDIINTQTFNAYTVGDILVISGWFKFNSNVIEAGTTLFTLGNNKQFQTRYYLPLFTSDDTSLLGVECRESTNIARVRRQFTSLDTNIYYYISATVCIK